jgi:hypothetical protein
MQARIKNCALAVLMGVLFGTVIVLVFAKPAFAQSPVFGESAALCWSQCHDLGSGWIECCETCAADECADCETGVKEECETVVAQGCGPG